MRNTERGMSFAEVLMSLAIIGILIYAVATMTSTGIQSTKTNTDRQFAIQKALSMLDELKSLVQVNNAGSINVLDQYHDGTLFRSRLTTIGNVLTDPPEEAISANLPLDAGRTRWVYSRQISVEPLSDPNNPNLIISSNDVRLVRVRVYRNNYDSAGNVATRRLLAEVASVIRTLAVAFPPTQVYDVYCVAIENAPGWWVNMSSLVPFVQAAINDLETRHPGLEFRQHWITHMSYGRDSQYRPFINSVNDTLMPIPWVYFYPGLLPTTYTLERPLASGSLTTSPSAQFYYPPSSFDAQMRDETGFLNGVSGNNPLPYTLADQYNHSMRYPDELALYNSRLADTTNYPNEQPTLRILLEQMYQNPNAFTNALFINLHGELLPFPPIRNYSDAAKKPDFYTGIPTGAVAAYSPANVTPPQVTHNGVRVVTHPENLAYDTTAAPNASVNLRVYSYLNNPNLTQRPAGAAPGYANPASCNNTGAAGSMFNCLTAAIFEPSAAGGRRQMGPAPAGPAAGTEVGWQQEYLREPISVIIRNVNWTPAGANGDQIVAINGGVDLDPLVFSGPNVTQPTYASVAVAPAGSSMRDPYSVVAPAPNVDLAAPRHQMYWTRTSMANASGGTDTVIKLWNSPLVSPCVPNPANCTTNQAGVGGPGGQRASGGIEHNSGTNTYRLYGMEYIPSPMENFAQAAAQTPFAANLATAGRSEKNTARWVIQIPANALPNGAAVQVDTYIGDYNVGTNQIDNLPQHGGGQYTESTNQSRTYFWRGTNTYLFGPGGGAGGGGNLPITERYQIIGDPRHCPYADLKKPHANGGGWAAANISTALGMGYNRYFDDFENDPAAAAPMPVGEGNKAAQWPGWSYNAGGTYGIKNDGNYTNDGWVTTNGQIELDVPRIYQIFRSGLLFTNSLYTTMTGYPYYYLGIGNEIGGDQASGFDDNVPVSRRPFYGTDSPPVGAAPLYFEQAITPGRDWGDTGALPNPLPNPADYRSRTSVKMVKAADDTWWSASWLGELYPDDRYVPNGAPAAGWRANGNLAPPDPTAGEAANRADRFLRCRRDLVPANQPANLTHTPGTTFGPTARRTHEEGIPTFYWSGNSSVNIGSGTTGNLAAGGTEIQTNFNMPLLNPIDANRPFDTGMAAQPTDGLNQAIYGPNLTTTGMRQFYSSNTNPLNASNLYAQRDNQTQRACFVVQNGLSPTDVAGTDFIARWAFLSLIQGFFEAGLFNAGAAPAVTQLPRLRITDPNPNTDLSNPGSVTVQWAETWQRWDGRKYANAYPANFTEVTPRSYVVLVSNDNGQTWRYIMPNGSMSAAGSGVLGRRPVAGDPWRHTAVSVVWQTPNGAWPGGVPVGAYIVRVEVYRDNFPLHYAYHQYQMFITR